MARTETATLAVDVGNTNTVLGLFRAGKIQRRWRLATRRDNTVDEIAWQLEGLVNSGKGSEGIAAAAIASVVPALDDGWVRALEMVLGAPPEVLDYTNCLGLKLAYEIPWQIGADRLANVLGAHALGHVEGMAVDLGTATTFDVFGRNTYWGGVICPGMKTSLRTLTQISAKLSDVELRWTEKAVGKTTDDALRIGMLRGTVGQVEYLVKAIAGEMGMRKPSVIATGGLAPLLEGRSPVITHLEPDLTLIGINHLITAKKKRKK